VEEPEAKVAPQSSQFWEGRWGFSEGRCRRRFLGSIVAIILMKRERERDDERMRHFYWALRLRENIIYG
jgi:hypothetical protein